MASANSTETEHTPTRSQGQYRIHRFKHHSTATTSIGYRTRTGCASTPMCNARRFRLRSAMGTLTASRLIGPSESYYGFLLPFCEAIRPSIDVQKGSWCFCSFEPIPWSLFVIVVFAWTARSLKGVFQPKQNQGRDDQNFGQ